MEIVFDIIKLNFDLSSKSVLPADFYSKRFVDGNATDAQWLSHAKIIKHVAFNQSIKFAVIEFNSEFYFITIGLDDPDYLPTGIIEEKVNAGLLTLIISQFELPIKNGISNFYLEENIISQSVIDPLYKGHDKADLEKIFPNIYAMKITSGFGGDQKNIYQLIAFLITLTASLFFCHLQRLRLIKFMN